MICANLYLYESIYSLEAIRNKIIHSVYITRLSNIQGFEKGKEMSILTFKTIVLTLKVCYRLKIQWGGGRLGRMGWMVKEVQISSW